MHFLGPCDPGNPSLAHTCLRADGFPGSHGPDHQDDTNSLKIAKCVDPNKAIGEVRGKWPWTNNLGRFSI